MDYQVLARKWRPNDFSSIVGQTHVLQALNNAFERQRVHHAYLLTGTRGVGKTTLARVIAKCLNCEEGVSGQPCGQCQACVDIEQGRYVDLIEIDAASRTKVEDTRELIDTVQYRPTQGRYKVYLIDEVHMLSGHSFNALLKTLEEPPEYVVFILATTDPQRLPVTVLSRCLQFHLKNLTVEQIAGHLGTILQAESIEYEHEALITLAQAANGSMRDALSLLDQAINHADKVLSSQDVRSMLGVVSQSAVLSLIDAVLHQQHTHLIAGIEALASETSDFDAVISDLLTCLHELALVQYYPDNGELYTFDTDKLKPLAAEVSATDLQLLYQIALNGRKDLPIAPRPRLGFEMTLLRMMAFTPLSAAPETIERVVRAETIKQAAPAPVVASAPQARPSPAQQVVKQTKPQQQKQATNISPAVAKAAPSVVSSAVSKQDWPSLVKQLRLAGIAKIVMSHASLKSLTETGVVIGLPDEQMLILNDRIQTQIEEALRQSLGKPKLTFSVEQEGDAGAETPAKVAKREADAKKESIATELKRDPRVSSLLTEFDTDLSSSQIELTPTTDD